MITIQKKQVTTYSKPHHQIIILTFMFLNHIYSRLFCSFMCEWSAAHRLYHYDKQFLSYHNGKYHSNLIKRFDFFIPDSSHFQIKNSSHKIAKMFYKFSHIMVDRPFLETIIGYCSFNCFEEYFAVTNGLGKWAIDPARPQTFAHDNIVSALHRYKTILKICIGNILYTYCSALSTKTPIKALRWFCNSLALSRNHNLRNKIW